MQQASPLQCFHTQVQEDKSLLSQIPHHPFVKWNVTSSVHKIKQESITVLHERSKLVSDPEFTKSSLSPEIFESKPPSRVQANHHLSQQFLFLLSPVRLKDSSIIVAQSFKFPQKSNWNLWTSAVSDDDGRVSLKLDSFAWKTKLQKNKVNLVKGPWLVHYNVPFSILIFFFYCYYYYVHVV